MMSDPDGSINHRERLVGLLGFLELGRTMSDLDGSINHRERFGCRTEQNDG